MRILFVVHDYWPNYHAGVENHTHDLAHALAEKGHEIFIFTTEPFSEDNKVQEYKEEGIRVVKVHTIEKKISHPVETYINHDLDAIFEEKLKEINPDIVHIQHLIRLSLSFIDIIKKRKVPIVYTLHDFWFECPRLRTYKNDHNCKITKQPLKDCENCMQILMPMTILGKIKNLAYPTLHFVRHLPIIKQVATPFLDVYRAKKYARIREKIKNQERSSSSFKTHLISERWKVFQDHYKKVDMFISPSTFLAKRAINFGIDPNKIYVIPHGINPPKNFEKFINNKIYTKDSKITFGFLSHITKDKGFILLVKSFEKLALKYKNVKLVVYSGYDKKDKQISQAIQIVNKSENMEYKGPFKSEEIGKVFRSFDVAVVPSLWNEIYGLVIDESFLYKKPVIVSDRGGMPERVSGGTQGFIFDPSKASSLYQKMQLIAESPEILNSFAQNIPKVKPIDLYAAEIENYYKQLV